MKFTTKLPYDIFFQENFAESKYLFLLYNKKRNHR